MQSRFYMLTGLFAVVAGALALLPASAQAQAAVPVRQAAERVLASRFPDRAGRMEVRVRRTGGAIPGGENLRLEFAQSGDVPEGLTRVKVTGRASSAQRTQDGWALLYVAHFDSIVTARGRIRSGEAVAPGAVEIAWIETTDFRGEPLRARDFHDLTAKGALVATRILRAGRTLRRRDVRPPYTADTGTAIEMHYTRGDLTFRMTCKAREPGFAQEAIRVYCPGTRTTYRARLTDDHTARWLETL